MLNTMLDNTATEQARHAYNAAFEELGLSWHWDAATYARLQNSAHGAVRTYLEAEQSHLLRAYEADFLVEAIEAAKARCHASMAATKVDPGPYVSWSGYSPAPANSRPAHTTPAPRFTPSALQT